MKSILIIVLSLTIGWVAMLQAAEPPASQPEAVAELRPILSPQAKRDAAIQLIEKFVAHVNASNEFDAGAKSAVTQGWEKHRQDEEPEGFLMAGLSIISEPFKTGLTSLEEEKFTEADETLKSLTSAADPYLALNAAGLYARSLVEQEKLEEAEVILGPLAVKEEELIEKSFLETEVGFLLGYCQLSNLRYEEALATLVRFEAEHPDAPDSFRLPAHQMLQELLLRKPESLGEVSDLMVYAGRRLANGEPGKPVQIKQDRAIELLAKLIEEAEQREQQQKQSKGGGGGKKGSGSPRGFQQGARPADRSSLPPGKGQMGSLDDAPHVKPGDEWGKMRPEERERILQSLRKNFPSRYRQLVEQYYKQLAKEK